MNPQDVNKTDNQIDSYRRKLLGGGAAIEEELQRADGHGEKAETEPVEGL